MENHIKHRDLISYSLHDDIAREMSSRYHDSMEGIIVKALEKNGHTFATKEDLHAFIKQRCTVVQFLEQHCDEYVIDFGKPGQVVFLTVDKHQEIMPMVNWFAPENKTTISVEIKYRIHNLSDENDKESS